MSYPGVYVEEVSSGVHTITGVSTSVAAFFGRASRGPINRAVRLLSLSDYARQFGEPHPKSDLAHSVRLFFENGGADGSEGNKRWCFDRRAFVNGADRPESGPQGFAAGIPGANGPGGDGAQGDAGGAPSAPPTISLGKGGSAVRGMGEKFSANLVSGTDSLSVPIYTSLGRSGFGPELSLSYDSGAGNSPFGFGLEPFAFLHYSQEEKGVAQV